jgi:hypothetical protein
VIVLVNHTVGKFVDQDMENFIHFTVDAQTNLGTLIEIVADRTTKTVVGGDGDAVVRVSETLYRRRCFSEFRSVP